MGLAKELPDNVMTSQKAPKASRQMGFKNFILSNYCINPPLAFSDHANNDAVGNAGYQPVGILNIARLDADFIGAGGMSNAGFSLLNRNFRDPQPALDRDHPVI